MRNFKIFNRFITPQAQIKKSQAPSNKYLVYSPFKI